MNVRQQLKDFLIQNYLGDTNLSLGDDDSLLEKGVIDSIGVIELVGFLQQTYTIHVFPHEIVPQNFDTIAGLCRYIRTKKPSS